MMQQPYSSILTERESVFNSLGYTLELINDDIADLNSINASVRIAVEPNDLHPSVSIINKSGKQFAVHIVQDIVAPDLYRLDVEALRGYSDHNDVEVASNFEIYVAMQIDMLIQFMRTTLLEIDLEAERFLSRYEERNRGLT